MANDDERKGHLHWPPIGNGPWAIGLFWITFVVATNAVIQAIIIAVLIAYLYK
jgi:hypothetical protein